MLLPTSHVTTCRTILTCTMSYPVSATIYTNCHRIMFLGIHHLSLGHRLWYNPNCQCKFATARFLTFHNAIFARSPGFGNVKASTVIDEFMMYRVVYVFLYYCHWKVHTISFVPNVDDCSALWIGNPTLIDVDVHLPCLILSIYKIELDTSILTFSRNFPWSLHITFVISKCMLFHTPKDHLQIKTIIFP